MTRKQRNSNSVSDGLLVLALVALHLAVTLPLAALLSISLDENYSLETTGRDLGYALGQAVYSELQPPGYFLLLNLWRQLSPSIFHARFLSVICAALMLWTIAELARRYFSDIHRGWFVALCAFHPFVIWAAVEARVYALVLLVSAQLMLWFYDGWLDEKEQAQRARLVYAVLALCGLYTHYYLGFLLAAQAAALLAQGKMAKLRNYIGWMMAVGVGFLPMLWFVRSQVSAHTATTARPQSWLADLQVLSWWAQTHLLPADWSALTRPARWLLLGGALLIAIGVGRRIFAKSLILKNSIPVTLAVICGVVALFYVATIRVTGAALMERRHTAEMFLPLLLAWMALMLTALKKNGLVAWIVVSLIFSTASAVATWRPLAKSGDWKRVAAWMQSVESQNQPIAVFVVNGKHSLRQYYKGVNPVWQLPEETRFDRFDPRDHAFKSKEQVAATLNRLTGAKGELWLITRPGDECYSLGVWMGCDWLDEYLARNYVTTRDAVFFGSRVRLLHRRAAVASG
jgi:uncharacterized membrane protein